MEPAAPLPSKRHSTGNVVLACDKIEIVAETTFTNGVTSTPV